MHKLSLCPFGVWCCSSGPTHSCTALLSAAPICTVQLLHFWVLVVLIRGDTAGRDSFPAAQKFWCWTTHIPVTASDCLMMPGEHRGSALCPCPPQGRPHSRWLNTMTGVTRQAKSAWATTDPGAGFSCSHLMPLVMPWDIWNFSTMVADVVQELPGIHVLFRVLAREQARHCQTSEMVLMQVCGQLN